MPGGARFLKYRRAMLLSLAVVISVLGSPFPGTTEMQPPKPALFHVYGPDEAAGTPRLPTVSAPLGADERGWMGRLVDHLAVVKPHQAGTAQPSTLQMFVLVAPMKGQVGVQAFGSF